MNQPLCFSGMPSLAAAMGVSLRKANRMRADGRLLKPDGKLGRAYYWLASRVESWLRAGAPSADEWAAIEQGAALGRRRVAG